MKLNGALMQSLLTIMLFSCDSEEVVILQNDIELAVKDGRVKFQNVEMLSNFMEQAKKSTNSEFVGTLRKLKEHGFNSLQPESDGDDFQEVERMQERKVNERASLSSRYPAARAFEEELVMDDEDEIIADPYFASILNEGREILVDSNVYKYTVDGVYYTTEDNVDVLYEYLANKPEEEDDSGGRVAALGNGTIEVAPRVFLAKPVPNDDAIDENPCEAGDPCDPGQSYKGGSSSAEPDPENFKLCGEMRSNVWTKVFGPKVECIDHHANNERIKTKVWNQNYRLYSSVGISVRAQKRKLRIWWAQKVDELRLGFSHATFEYPQVKIQWPDNQVDYFYTTPNGHNVNQLGHPQDPAVLHPINLFDRFPINDRDKKFFVIYTKNKFVTDLLENCIVKNGKCVLFDLTASDLNRRAQKLAKTSVTSLWNWGEGNLEEKSPLLAVEMSSCTGSTQATCKDEKLYFNYVNWSRQVFNKSNIKYIFDWNTAEIKIILNGKDRFSDQKIRIKNTAKSYKKLSLTGYGLGRKGTTWKGGRVKFHHSQ